MKKTNDKYFASDKRGKFYRSNGLDKLAPNVPNYTISHYTMPLPPIGKWLALLLFFLLTPLLTSPPVKAQLSVDVTAEGDNNLIIAVPAFITPQNAPTEAGSTSELGQKISDVIAGDLARSGLFVPLGRGRVRAIGVNEVEAPQYPAWKSSSASALVQGYVKRQTNGRIEVGCYLYDILLETLLVNDGYAIIAGDWRRAAHKCADSIYARLTGETPFFDSRIAYIAETGPKENRRKRLAVMDSDGANHRFITNGQATALTPRFSPDYGEILYLSYLDGLPRIYIYTIGSGRQRLVFEGENTTLAPRWSPDGRWILFSMVISGNTDIYKINADGNGKPIRLTSSPGIDIAGSFSPNGQYVTFESDRSGSQQIYIMRQDGSQQRRISYGQGRYATPEWSPRGDLISFTKIAGNFRIGVMSPMGDGEKLLTNSWQDEAPSWAPNGRVIQFFRTQKNSGRTSIWQVDLTGRNERRLLTPVDASDPAWGPLLP